MGEVLTQNEQIDTEQLKGDLMKDIDDLSADEKKGVINNLEE